VRLGERDQLVVGVERLRGLVGIDRDRRQRRHQAAAVEHALDDRQHALVHRDHLVDRAAREQVVDPHGARALEQVRRRLRGELALEPEDVVAQLHHQGWIDRVRDDREPIALHPVEVVASLACGPSSEPRVNHASRVESTLERSHVRIATVRAVAAMSPSWLHIGIRQCAERSQTSVCRSCAYAAHERDVDPHDPSLDGCIVLLSCARG
jgi:hypothetical protein